MSEVTESALPIYKWAQDGNLHRVPQAISGERMSLANSMGGWHVWPLGTDVAASIKEARTYYGEVGGEIVAVYLDEADFCDFKGTSNAT